MKRFVLGVVCVAAFGTSVQAMVQEVDLLLDESSASINRAAITVEAIYGSLVRNDTDDSDASGNMLANLTLSVDPVTRLATLSGLEFTGGRMAFSDVSFELNYGLGGKILASGTGLAGTFDTPSPPGPVSGGQFNAIHHDVILNEGQFDAHATFPLSLVFPATTMDLSDEPIVPVIDQVGAIAVSAPTIVGYDATYEVVLTLPLEFVEVIYDADGIVATVSGSGTLRARDEFTITSPPLPGDATMDGQVDDLDAARMAEHWLQPAGWTGGDFNDDGFVDDRDAAILAAHWVRGAEGAAVPEPSTLVGLLTLLAAGACLRVGRR